MARVQGYKCDLPTCNTLVFEEKAPVGWIRVQPITDNGSTDSFDLCSNKCLVALARQRRSAEIETRHTEPGTPGNRSARGYSRSQAQYVIKHDKGKHTDEPVEGCPKCEEETAP